MIKLNKQIWVVAIITLSAGLSACSNSDEPQVNSQSLKPGQDTTSTHDHSSGMRQKYVAISILDKEMVELRQTFHDYMLACVEKDIDAMTEVYDLEHIAVKWEEKVGNDPNEIREMIKGIVANKPDEFYRMCARAQMESDKLIEKVIPDSVGKAQIVEVKYGDWSWTFSKRPTGWKLIEECVSGQTFDRLSGAQGH